MLRARSLSSVEQIGHTEVVREDEEVGDMEADVELGRLCEE